MGTSKPRRCDAPGCSCAAVVNGLCAAHLDESGWQGACPDCGGAAVEEGAVPAELAGSRGSDVTPDVAEAEYRRALLAHQEAGRRNDLQALEQARTELRAVGARLSLGAIVRLRADGHEALPAIEVEGKGA